MVKRWLQVAVVGLFWIIGTILLLGLFSAAAGRPIWVGCCAASSGPASE